MPSKPWFKFPKRAELDIVTITIGREEYLAEQFAKLHANRRAFRQHIFVENGCSVSPTTRRWLKKLGSRVLTVDAMAVGACLEEIKPYLESMHTMKLDDDAIPVGDRFFDHVHALIELLPDRVFSPFPVGLLHNLGGPKLREGDSHDVVHSPKTDTYYTLRPVDHVGGFARISPSSCYGMLTFDPVSHSEDTEFSRAMRHGNVPMCYLENALIVEHAETVWGQRARNPDYRTQKLARWEKLKNVQP